MNKELLQNMVADKLVSVQKHPECDLFIYNYTPKVQYDKLWNEITLNTRGLILNANLDIVARPFGKFFNIEEHEIYELPKLPFDVYEKLDGSLGILYWLNNKPFIATRGSFTSDQSIHATRILYNKYKRTFGLLDRSCTYLFEIIYPENRIVVDYGKMDDLILLTVIDNFTGRERIEDVGFPIVKKFNGINDINHLRGLEEDNKEGFVIRFENGFRVKLKFQEYVRLHRIITGVSNVAIWEYLSQGKSLEELLDRVPDEFYDWVKHTQKELDIEFNGILNECMLSFKEFDTRKETALYFKTKKYQSVLFSMLDGRTPNKIIWKMIRPKYSRPFKLYRK
jgi:RNA ligase